MSRHGAAIREALAELGGTADLNAISFQCCLPLPTIRYHLNLHCTRDEDTGDWCDAYRWDTVLRDGEKVIVYSLTGLEPL